MKRDTELFVLKIMALTSTGTVMLILGMWGFIIYTPDPHDIPVRSIVGMLGLWPYPSMMITGIFFIWQGWKKMQKRWG